MKIAKVMEHVMKPSSTSRKRSRGLACPPRTWLVLSVLLLAGTASADVTNVWPFRVESDYQVSDPLRAEVDPALPGKAQLILQAQSIYHTTFADYELGLLLSYLGLGSDTSVRLSGLAGSYNSPGFFVSRPLDAGALNVWERIDARVSNTDFWNSLAQTPLSMPGLIALYHLNNDAGTPWKDEVTGNNAVPVNSPDLISETFFGSHAARFYGSSRSVGLYNPTLLNGATECTISCWVLLRSFQDYAGILYSNGTGAWPGWHQQPAGERTLRFRIYARDGSSMPICSTQFELNQWYFIAGTWNAASGIARTYVNGERNASGPPTATGPMGQADVFRLAWDDGAGTRRSNCDIDEVAIFNRELSAEEIRRLYHAYYPVRMRVRSGTALPLAGEFVGPDGTTNSYYSGKDEVLVSGGGFSNDHQYVQYQAELFSNSGLTETPHLESVGFYGDRGEDIDNLFREFEQGTFGTDTLAMPASEVVPSLGMAKQRNGGYYTNGLYESRVFSFTNTVQWKQITWGLVKELASTTPGLVALWHLNGNWSDSSGNGNTVFPASSAYTRLAKLGTQSAVFDESALHHTDGFGNLGTVKTVEFWISDDKAYDEVMRLNAGTYIYITNNTLTVGNSNNVPVQVFVNGSAVSPRLMSDWNHVAVVFEDGITVDALDVGCVNGSYMTGMLDELALYTRALAEGEILEHCVAQRRNVAGNVSLQVRIGSSPTNMGTWVGSDGLPTSYFEDPPAPATPNLQGVVADSQCFQYRVFFDGDGSSTPMVDSVDISTFFAGTVSDRTRDDFFQGSFGTGETAWYGDLMELENLVGLGPANISPAAAGLLGLWHFDDDSWATPDSVTATKGLNGNAAGNAHPVRPGQVGSHCGSFDGADDYITLSSISLGAADFSVSAWFSTISANQAAIVSSWDGNQYFSLEINSDGVGQSVGRVALALDDGGVGEVTVVSQSGNLNDGLWHNVVGMRNGDQLIIYVDGDRVGSTDITGLLGIGSVTPQVAKRGTGTMYFDGFIDEVAIYTRAITEAEIGENVASGHGTAQTGEYESETLDAGDPAIWQTITWVTDGPYGSRLSPMADTSLIALWSMENAGGGIATNSVVGSNDGTVNGATAVTNGRLGSCLSFDGLNDVVTIDAPLNTLEPGTVTVEAWVNMDAVNDRVIFDKSAGGNGYRIGTAADGRPYVWIGGVYCYGYMPVRIAKWTHIAGVWDGTEMKLYIDGLCAGDNVPGAVSTVSGAQAAIGSSSAGGNYLPGRIDEVAIHDRALTPSEIADHYKAGAVTLKFQVKSHLTDPLVPGTWMGPGLAGGNPATYYTESAGSDMRDIDLGQYFRYKAYFKTEDARITPRLNGTRVFVSSYPGDNPTVVPIAASNFFGRLVSFEDDVFVTDPSSYVRYQISGDGGTTWYFWDTGVVPASWSTNINPALPLDQYTSSRAEIQAGLPVFFDNFYPKTGGDFMFKAFLHSRGDYQVELREVRLIASEGRIVITSPNGTENGTRSWVTSVPYDITWDSTGNVGTVSIDLYDSGGSNWIKNLGSGLPNNGVFNTVVHDNEGKFRIKISDETDGTIHDISDGDFTLTNDFHLTSPDGGEFWYVGENNTIRWDSPSPVPAINVDLWFSWDGNNSSNLASWIRLDPAILKPNVIGNNSYVWATPSNDWRFVSELAKMAVTPKDLPHPLLTGAAKRDFSDDVFTMAGIAITYPAAGIGVKTGNAIGIKWYAAGAGTNGVMIRLYDGTSWSVLSSNAPCVPGTNVFVAVLLGETEAARIEIKSNSAPPNDVYGISDPFTLADINVRSPIGGSAGVRDYWQIGTTNYVRWTASGAGPSVNVEYTTSGSSNWYPIAMNATNFNSTTNVITNMVQWIVKGPPSDTVQVRVKTTDPLQPDLYDTTLPFTVPGIELTQPTGGEVWEFTGTNRVRWLNMGGIGGVDIDISFDSGAHYETVKADAFTQDGENYYDLFPGMIRRPSVHAVFRLTQTNTISGLPAIDSMERMGTELTIRGLSVPVPTNGAVYTLGTTVVDGLHWFSAFTGDPDADLRYSPDGVNYNDVIMNGPSTFFSNLDEDTCSNRYDWVISRRFKPSLNARVKVIAGFYEAVSAPFVMRGVRITAPAKGEMFDIGSSQFIRWDAEGLQLAAVASNYVSTVGEAGPYIKGGLTDPSTILFNALQWDIDPDIDPTTNAVIKMEIYAPAQDTDIIAYSEPFTLRGLKLSSPTAGTNWWLGGSETVSFRAAGMGAGAWASVYYSSDGVNFDMDNPITNNMSIADGLNAFTWDIESSYALARTPSTNARVMIVSGTHTNISPAFTLSGIRITKPVSGDVLAVSDGTSLIDWEAVGVSSNQALSFTVWEGSTNAMPYTEPIATIPAGTTFYVWPMPSTCIGKRVTLQIVSGGINGYSEEFEIVAQPTVRLQDLEPLMEYLKVGQSKKIEWVKAGDMTNSFRLYYAREPGGSLVQLQAGAFPLTNGVYSYNWDPIPETYLGPIRIVITNTVTPSIFDISTNFTIAPTYDIRTFTADLYALKEHRVYFTPHGAGTDFVDLYYTTDPLRSPASWIKINSTPFPAQNNIETYYPWAVADIRTNTVWLRIQDDSYSNQMFTAARPGPYDDYGMFEVKYYRILWRVFDAATSNELNNLSVADSSGWSGSGLTSPIEHWYPYGTWNTEWYREYFSDEVVFNWNSRANTTNEVWMERSEIEPDYHVMANFTYDVLTTNFMIQAWLERSGAILSTPEDCTIRVYDSSGNLVETLNGTTLLNGVYWLNWNVSGRGFSSTEVFFARVEIKFSGATYSSGITFMMRMSASSEIQTVIDQIQNSTTNILASVAGVNTNVNALRGEISVGMSNLTAVVTNMASDLGAMTNALLTGMTVLTNQMDQLITTVGPLTNMASQVTAIEDDTIANLARILTRPTTLLYGSTNNVLYKTRPGYAAGNVTITVSNATQGLVDSGAMTEVVGGIYEAMLVADWGTNSYTITCSDLRARDSMIVEVVGEALDAVPALLTALEANMNSRLGAISNQIATVDTIVRGIQGADLTPVLGSIDEIKGDIGTLKGDVTGVKKETGEILGGLDAVAALLGDVSDSSSANTFFGRLSEILGSTDAAGESASQAAKNAQSAKTEASSAASGVQGVKSALEKGDLESAYRMLEDVKRSVLTSQESISQIARMLPLADMHGELKIMADNMRKLTDSKTFQQWINWEAPPEGEEKEKEKGKEGANLEDEILVLNKNMEEVKRSMKFMQKLMDEMRYEPVVEETLLPAD